jgi:glyoxylase-like metal-dependent hydrolase (beta-lactamase superfamily II)
MVYCVANQNNKQEKGVEMKCFFERLDNIYAIDTNMWNFDHYMSVYLVVGKEIALVDAGWPNKLDYVVSGIKKAGYSPSDISYIFCCHGEHQDHAGNSAALLRLAPKASLYVNKVGLHSLLDPNTEIAKKRSADTPEVAAMRPDMEPVPLERIKFLNDGDVFDLGNGEKLTVYFTPGHQPSGIAIYEEKHKGVFINDLVGACFLDVDSHYQFTPAGSDWLQIIDSLKRLSSLPLDYLYLGHYGITDQTYPLINTIIKDMERILDIGKEYVRAGKVDQIPAKFLEMMEPELQKLRLGRGEQEYKYATGNHQRKQSQAFAEYCIKKFS